MRLTNTWLASDKAASSNAFKDLHVLQIVGHNVILVMEQQGETNAWMVLKLKGGDIKISNCSWEELKKFIGIRIIITIDFVGITLVLHVDIRIVDLGIMFNSSHSIGNEILENIKLYGYNVLGDVIF